MVNKANLLNKLAKLKQPIVGKSEAPVVEAVTRDEHVERIITGDDKARDKLTKLIKQYNKKSTDDSDSEDEDDDKELLKALSHHTIAYGLPLSNGYTYMYYKRFRNTIPDYLITKEDNVQELWQKRAKDVTLQVFNVSATEQELTNFFGKFGTVDKVIKCEPIKSTVCYLLDDPFVHNTHVSKLTSAYVVFVEKQAIIQALLAPELVGKLTKYTMTSTKTGLQEYASQHGNEMSSYKNLKLEQSNLNNWLKQYDKKKKKDQQLVDVLRNRPDEQGWIKVVAQKGKKFTPSITGSDLIKRRQEMEKKKFVPTKTRLQEEMPFYKFQRVAKQKNSVQSLRDKFEQDKKTIEKMKHKFASINARL